MERKDITWRDLLQDFVTGLEKSIEEFEYLEPEEAWSLHWWRRAYLALGEEGKADKIAKKLAKAKGRRDVPIVHDDLPAQQPGKPVKR